MADNPDVHHNQSQMDQSKNTAENDIQPNRNTTKQRKPAHVLSGNKYFIILTGKTLNSHKKFIDQLKTKISSLEKVNRVDECDFILAFCPVVTRAGTDIEAAMKQLSQTSATKPAVLVVLHHTFDPEFVVQNSCTAVERKNTITVDCLFNEDQGLLPCPKNYDAVNHIKMQFQPKIQTPTLDKIGQLFNKNSKPEQRSSTQPPDTSGSQSKQNAPEFRNAVDKVCKDTEQLEDIEKEIGEKILLQNNEFIIATELRLVLLGMTESDKTAAKNIILGREEMNQCASSTTTATEQSESAQMIAGTKVMLVEKPDLFSPGFSVEELSQTVGPQAFLLVIPLKYLEDKMHSEDETRMTDVSEDETRMADVSEDETRMADVSEDETQMTLLKVEEIFGERYWRNTMILFTVSDELQKKSIEKIKQSGNQEVQRLLEKCGNRFHCLNVKESEDGSQVSELLEKVEKIVKGHRNVSETYQMIREKERERHDKDLQIKKIQKNVKKYEQYIGELKNDLKSNDIDAVNREIIEKLIKKYKLKRDIGEQIKMRYESVAELEENRQFIKVILPENQQPIWLSLPVIENKTPEKRNELAELADKFVKL